MFGLIPISLQAQISKEEVASEASIITARQNIVKTDLPMRMGNGATSIIPHFEGNLWDEDSKGAVRYACQLLEEYLPTMYPVNIQMKRGTNFGNTAFATTTVTTIANENSEYVEVPLDVSSVKYPYRVPLATVKKLGISSDRELFYSTNALFSDFDGTIQFSAQDIFSHTIDGNVESDKYDLVTVTLREIAKILGMHPGVRRAGATALSPLDTKGYITPYAYRIFVNHFEEDNNTAYQYATSGKARVGHDNQDWSYELYSPSIFNQTKSLFYFAEDPDNLETILLQPELPKETSITRIGKGLLSTLGLSGWQYISEGTGIGGSGGGSGMTDKGIVVTPNEKKMTFGNANLRTSRILTAQEIEILDEKRLNKELSKTIKTRALAPAGFQYPYFREDGIISDLFGADRGDFSLMGWSFYLIRKDGKLDRIAQADRDVENFVVDLSTITNFDLYSRTSDGFLRGRLNCNKYDYSPAYFGSGYKFNTSQHIYVKYNPATPTLAIKKNYLRAAGDDPYDYYKEVDLNFSNAMGVKNGWIIQKEYDGGAVYTSNYPVELTSGSYIATIDKELKTTFQLVVTNDIGESYSNIITIEPTTSFSSYNMNLNRSSNILQVNFTDNNEMPTTVDVVSGKIFSITNPAIAPTKIDTNQVDISNLPSGVYGVTVTDKNNNTYTEKFIK